MFPEMASEAVVRIILGSPGSGGLRGFARVSAVAFGVAQMDLVSGAAIIVLAESSSDSWLR